MARTREVTIVESSELPTRGARRIAALIHELAAQSEQTISLALAGGSTPRAMHEKLALLDLPWSRLEIFFGDERCVPADSADSNYRMAKESLLDRVPIARERVHRMPGELADHDAAARAYEAVLPPSIDVLVLGIGEDGHTASLFPGAAALAERGRRVLPVVGPKPPPHRLTVTPPVVEAARNIVVLAAGAGKAEPVQRALEGAWGPLQTPAQLAREGLWILDPGAATKLALR